MIWRLGQIPILFAPKLTFVPLEMQIQGCSLRNELRLIRPMVRGLHVGKESR
jgi:hypothetical protein